MMGAYKAALAALLASPHKGEGGFALFGALTISLCLGLAALAGQAKADKVGVAAAVNPDAFSSLGSAPQTQINIGKSIFYNERINTTGSGLVQVLLVDGSTFTVGPGSDLIIDKFVYNPKKGAGQISASFSKGVMRFVGGKISKNEGGVTVNTPAGALAIRGAISYIKFKDAKNYSILCVFCKYIKLKGKTLFQEGYGFFIENGVWTTRRFTSADLKDFLTAFNNRGGTWSGGTPGSYIGINPSFAGIRFLQINNTSATPDEWVSDATQMHIQAQLQEPVCEEGSDCSPPPSCEETGTCSPPPSCEETGTCSPPPSCEETGTCSPPPSCEETGTCSPPPSCEETGTCSSPPEGGLPPATAGDAGGYAAGMRKGPGNTYSSTVKSVSFDPATRQLTFQLSGEDSDLITIEFDSNNQPTKSVTVLQGGQQAQVNGASQATLTTRAETLCSECSFLSWGNWDAHITYKNVSSNGNTNLDVDRGWWVAGEVTTAGDIDKLATLGATASYSGSVQGTVASNLGNGNAWQTYDASGGLTMKWNFGNQSGDLLISNFDGRNYTASNLTQPNLTINQFGGSLTQAEGTSIGTMTGSATGSFVNNGSVAAGGVMGNWNVDSANYKAMGIFGGAGTPVLPTP
jgi:FecR protein